MRIAEGLRWVTVAIATLSFSTVLCSAQSTFKEVTGKIIVEGGVAPGFSLPVQGIGRPSTRIAINPQSDGTFKASFPVGLSIVGAVTGPAGFSIRSIMYGSTDLLKEPLNIAATDAAELVIVLNAPRLGS